MIEAELLMPQVNTAGLVAHYKLQFGPMGPGKVFDYSFGGFEGALAGSNITPAYPGFRFNGTDDFIDVGTGPTSVSTTLLWVNPTGTPLNDIPISLNVTDSLTIVNGVLTKEGFAGGDTVLYVDGVSGTAVTANWHLVGITDTSAKNATALKIGAIIVVPAVVEFFFDGLIGETFLFDRVLSANETRSVFEITRSTYGV